MSIFTFGALIYYWGLKRELKKLERKIRRIFIGRKTNEKKVNNKGDVNEGDKVTNKMENNEGGSNGQKGKKDDEMVKLIAEENLKKLKEELISDEGIVYKIYHDSLGYKHFGIGHLILPTDKEHG